jgi:hypothetical protein
MEVVKERSAFLSNYEVYALLKETQRGMKKKSGGLQNLATVVYETSQYLETTPCKNQTPEDIESCLKKLQKFQLTKTEKLQLLNLRPVSQVEIHLIIEDIDDRFSEDKISEMIAAIEDLPKGSDDVPMETTDDKNP